MTRQALVTGAAGFLGQSVVRALAETGWEVRGLVRGTSSADLVRAAGGVPVIGDVTRPETLRSPVEGTELVIHLAQPRDGTLEERRTVRVGGAQNIVEAMTLARCRRLVIGSGYWVYEGGPAEIREESPISPRSISQVNFETEEVGATAARAGRLELTVVRPGMVYGRGSWFREMVRELNAAEYRYIDDGGNFLSPIHLDDAGAAFAHVATNWRPGSAYLAVDDQPVSTREFAEATARLIGSPPPGSLPFAEAAREWGEDLARLNSASRRASNARLRATGWAPRFPAFAAGLPTVLPVE